MAGMDTFQISLHWAANIDESYGGQQNCYFFASVVAEHLCSLDETCEISGALRWLDLGGAVRDTIRRRISESSPTMRSKVPSSRRVSSPTADTDSYINTTQDADLSIVMELAVWRHRYAQAPSFLDITE